MRSADHEKRRQLDPKARCVLKLTFFTLLKFYNGI